MSFLSVLSVACLLSTGAVDPETGRPMDEVQFATIGKVDTFSWRDAEDQVEGFLTPVNRISGEPFEVSLRVRGFEGEPFKGPVVLTVRREGSQYGESVTVAPENERWKHAFTVDDGGRFQVDIAFRTSRMKVVHGYFTVQQGYGMPLSTYAMGAVILAAAIAIGAVVIRTARGRKPEAS
jgi:hypothetical protein